MRSPLGDWSYLDPFHYIGLHSVFGLDLNQTDPVDSRFTLADLTLSTAHRGIVDSGSCAMIELEVEINAVSKKQLDLWTSCQNT